jgi:hypothetical protein
MNNRETARRPFAVYHQMLAIRQASTSVANASAAQIVSVGESLRLPGGNDADFAAAGLGVRIILRHITQAEAKKASD